MGDILHYELVVQDVLQGKHFLKERKESSSRGTSYLSSKQED